MDEESITKRSLQKNSARVFRLPFVSFDNACQFPQTVLLDGFASPRKLQSGGNGKNPTPQTNQPEPIAARTS